jgi:DNA-binding NarL/FixJ family response regulator
MFKNKFFKTHKELRLAKIDAIIDLMLKGLRYKEIADKVDYSEATVRVYVHLWLKRHGLNSKFQAIEEYKKITALRENQVRSILPEQQ